MKRDLLPSTSRSDGWRRVSSSSASVASSRPSAEPMQKWMPRPNASVRRALARSDRTSGSVKTRRRGPRRPATGRASRPRELDAAERHRRVVTRRQTGPTGRSAASRRRRRATRRARRPPAPSATGPRAAAAPFADQVVRRLVSGEAEREQDRGDLLVGERRRVLVVDREQRAREVVAAVVGLGRHELAQVAAVGGHFCACAPAPPGRAGPTPGSRGCRTIPSAAASRPPARP